ncbi:hypothetical protein MCUN1_003697 [Malassezia cuniculi]|uniref:GOLD domain-containing protein n=1 Tax=Malassezia cuniculi TaxID=948313 RepID=A0AAF0J7N1_9BASI|nr:hypothetical protein MCUN1_003697 [Malassezia cuniculi]
MRSGDFGIARVVQFLIVVAAFLPLASASALTTKVKPHSKSCFYAWVDQRFEKVGFYFAVQDGGSFDIEYIVTSPSDRIIIEGAKSSQEDIVFTANEYGEYSFCFENYVSSYGEKLIDFDITVESEPRNELPITPAVLLSEQSSPVEESMGRLESDLMAIERTLRYFRLRENKGFSLVETTRIFETLLIVCISVGQVLVVRALFNKSSGTRFRV